MPLRGALQHFVFASLVLTCAPALAQKYPTKPIRLIVPYAPGGSSDIIARLYAQRLTETMGQTFVVDNRPGAGGTIGTDITAKSTPDGYTLLLQDMPHTINPAVYGKVPYDPLRDFEPVTLVARAPQWLFVFPAVPAKTVSELVALAKAQPGNLKIGSAGNGSGTHLMAELLMRGAGIRLNHVPYKGAGPALVDLIAGQVQMMCTSPLPSMPHVKSGKLRALAMTGPKRASFAPDVPAVAETLPGYQTTLWYALYAPAGTPQAIVKRIYDDTLKILRTKELTQQLESQGAEPVGNTPQELQKFVQTEIAQWTRLVKQARITAD